LPVAVTPAVSDGRWALLALCLSSVWKSRDSDAHALPPDSRCWDCRTLKSLIVDKEASRRDMWQRRAVVNGVDSVKDLGQELWRSSATNRSPPRQISFGSWCKHWLWGPPVVPSHSCLETLYCLRVPVVSCPRSPQCPLAPDSLGCFEQLCKEGGSCLQGQWARSGSCPRPHEPQWEGGRNTIGGQSSQETEWGSGWLPPTRESAEVSWPRARGFGCLVSSVELYWENWDLLCRSGQDPRRFERWESHATSSHHAESGKAQTLCTRLRGNREGRTSFTEAVWAPPLSHLYSAPSQNWVNEMAQWVKGLAAKPEELCLDLKTHRMEGKKWFLQLVLWLPRIHPLSTFAYL
jgi:hypothetical protein